MRLRDYDVVNNVTKVTLCFRCDGFHDVFTAIQMVPEQTANRLVPGSPLVKIVAPRGQVRWKRRCAGHNDSTVSEITRCRRDTVPFGQVFATGR